MSDAPWPDDNSRIGPEKPPSVSGEDLLPPVEPPSASFILQLFVVPALIVLVIVAVWLTFSWVVHRASGRPEDLVQRLQQGSSIARWQRASELADMLRNDRYRDFRTDSASAAKLAAILDKEIDAASGGNGMEEQAVMLRYFLCRALGEFQVPDGLDVLIKAARTNRDRNERVVRRGAIEAIAVLTFNLRSLEPPQEVVSPVLESALVELAADEDELIRSETAYTLGRIGTPACLEELESLVDDPHADTRYNAAVALAHHGRAKAVETLAEMLDPAETRSVQEEPDVRDQLAKRALIMSNAMRATEELAAKNPDADLSEVIRALNELIDANQAELQQVAIDPRRVQVAAKRTLEAIEKRP